MAKDEDSKKDLVEAGFDKALGKDCNLQAQIGNLKLKSKEDEDLMKKIRNNIKNIRKQRRRSRRR